MATKNQVREALATLTAAGFSVTLQSASGKSVTRGPQPSPPAPKKARKTRTKAERSAAQPKVKHCSKCHQPGHNAATCERRQRAAATPTVNMTSALLDGLPQTAPQAAPPPPPTPAEEGTFLDLGF